MIQRLNLRVECANKVHDPPLLRQRWQRDLHRHEARDVDALNRRAGLAEPLQYLHSVGLQDASQEVREDARRWGADLDVLVHRCFEGHQRHREGVQKDARADNRLRLNRLE